MNVRNLTGSKLLGGVKKKDRFRTVFFLSNPKDWYVITRRVYGIRRKATAWHHATACILLWIDSMHHFVMIPYATMSQFHTRLRLDFLILT